MKIIIVGDGKVGFALSESLSKEGHDITIIDNRTDVLKKSVDSLDVIAIRGNGASSAVQRQAGVADADLLIAATSMDEVNMVCCFVAKKLGARHTIARIRNPEYNEQLKLMQQEMGLSMVVNPELAAATEIARLISFPSALNIGTFAKGKVSMIEFRVSQDSPLVNKPLHALQGHFASQIIISAVNRGAELFIPKGDFVVEAGDNVYITGSPKNILGFLHSLGTDDKKIKSVFIVGGGLITFYLARQLVDSGISVTIFEKNSERCNMLCEKIPEALVICGDGTDKDLLDAEGLAYTGAMIALTDMDEENLIISMYAAYRGVPRVIAKINRLEYASVIRNAGIDRVISPKYIAVNDIVRYVRSMESLGGGDIKTLYRIIGQQAEILEFVATPLTRHLGVPLSELPLKDNVLITTIVRGDNVFIPKGRDCIQKGDRVILITALGGMEDLNHIYKE